MAGCRFVKGGDVVKTLYKSKITGEHQLKMCMHNKNVF